MKSVTLFLAICLKFLSAGADTWLQKTDFTGIPTGGAAGFSVNGYAYIGTGCCYEKGFWQYDPASDSWSQKADFAGEGRDYAVAFSIGNKGYIGTGQISNGFENDFWEYDPSSNSWTQKADFPGIKRSIAFAFSIGNKGYLGGGATNYTKEDFWEYDPSIDSWTQKADYGGGKVGGATAFTINEKAFVGTGRDNILAYRKDFWQYDPAINLWTQKADFPGQERAGSVGFSIGGLGYLGLGVTIDTVVKYLSDLWQYDPVADSWFQQTTYPGDAGDGATALTIDNIVYVGIGGTSGKQWWQYIPDSIATTVGKPFVKLQSVEIYPNPIVTSSRILFTLQQSSIVTMELLDLSGSKITTLVNNAFQAGKQDVEFNRENLSSGIYLLKLKMNNTSSVIKVNIQ